MQQDNISVARLVATVPVILSFLSGCGGSGGGDTIVPVVVEDNMLEMTISGSVGDGPVVGGTIVLHDANGTIVASQTSDEFSAYRMTFDVLDSEFPLFVTVEDGIDLVTGTIPDFPMMAAILAPGDGQVANLNPMGTLAVKIAQHMDGGLSAANLAGATRTVRAILNFGLDTVRFPDFISTDVNDDNVANVVRSSEAFGEAIRRTRDALISTGVTNAGQVIDALSADLIDGVLDGRGAAGVDPRISAVINVVSAQVVLETIANRLKVGGVAVTDRLDLAIQQITPGNPSVTLTGSVGVTDEILQQARLLLDIAMLLDSNPELASLRVAIDLVEPGQLQQDLPPQLQNDSGDVLGAVIQQVSVAPAEEIDRVNNAVRDGFDVVDDPLNRAPSISGSTDELVHAGSSYTFMPTASDPDNDELTFWISGQPSWANFNALTGLLSGTPGAGDIGTYSGISISVSDAGGASATLPVFAITVALDGLPNRVPSISGTPATQVTVGSPYSFTPTASDPDNDPLTFSISGKPSWASFNPGTGLLSGIAATAGTWPGIWITVSDGSSSTTLPSFTITVNAVPNRAPSISGSPATAVNMGSSYSFTPTASDPDNDLLTFSISGKPSWASFNPGSGRLSGTSGNAGTYSNIRITVSDGSASVSLAAFTITVNSLPNRAPTISGSAATAVMVDASYSFTPTASDPDNDPLTFSIAGKPAWANFDSATGRLSGTPGAGFVGTWSGISISVSDGNDSVSLGSFSIEVIAQAPGSATLFWAAPTQNEDGSALTDLAGYKVYYGTAVDSMTTIETIGNPSIATFLVENLHAGTWYFKVTAFDSTGNESVGSGIGSKIIQL